MAKTDSNVEVVLNNVRLAFEHVFRPQSGRLDKKTNTTSEPSFNAAFLVSKKDKKQDDMILDAIDKSMEMMWGKDKPRIKDDRKPYQNGDDYDYDGYPGHWVLNARNKRAPKVVHSKVDPDDKNEFLELFESDGVIYGGCRVNAIVRIWCQDYDGTKRVNCSLEAVQFFADDEPFGGAAKADTSKFKGMEGEVKDGGDFRKSRGERHGRDNDDDDRGSRRGRDDDKDDDRGRGRGKDDDDGRDTRSSRRGSRDDDDKSDRSERDRGRGRERDDAPERGRERDREEAPRRRSSEDDDSRSSDRPAERERSRGDRDEDQRSGRGDREDSRGRGDRDDRGSRDSSSRSRSDERSSEDEDRGSRRGRDRDDDRGRGRGDLV